MLVALEDDRPADDGRLVPVGPLHQPPPARGQVVGHLRRAQRQPLQVDHVDVALEPRGEQAAVVQAEELRGQPGLPAHDVLERQRRSARAALHPVRQHEGGHTAVADGAAVGAGVRQPEQRARVLVERAQQVEVAVGVVEEREVEHPAGRQVVVGELLRARAAAGGARREALLGARLVVVGVSDEEHLVEARGDEPRELAHVERGLGEQLRARLGPAQRGPALLGRQVEQLEIARVQRERVRGGLDAHDDADGPARHLREDRQALGGGLVELAEHVAPEGGRGVGLAEVEADRAARLARQLLHPGHLLGHPCVVGGELEEPRARLAQRVAEAEQLFTRGERSGHRLAVGRPVQERARGGEAERARADGLGDDLRHRRDVLGRGELVGGAALAHHVGADGRVRDLAGEVDRVRRLLERVEVLREGLPGPLDALVHGGARDVLHAFHQLDQPRAPVLLHGREAHAAGAHHGGGRAVPGGGREERVPGHLRVVVGVHVDEARGDQLAPGVELALARAQHAWALHRGDLAVL